MGGNRVKKGTRGEVTKYITRNKAVRRLQLKLNDFRRLCILKGIYPREPKHRKRVQKGNSEYKAQYYLKDIQFLSHEPLITKFREQRAHAKKIKAISDKGDEERYQMLVRNRPVHKLDHLIRERYPTFVDALRDLDDPLTLCFLFARLKKNRSLNEATILFCRRLSIEFMHYVIAARALRKVFISIKGYYYQAEIMGQTVTWIVPHPFRPENNSHVDYSIMKYFTEFYICLLGFVNFRLYQTLNMFYPPKLSAGETEVQKLDGVPKEEDPFEDNHLEKILISERIACLNEDLRKNKKDEEEEEEESIDVHLLEESVQNVKIALEEEKKVNELKKLFANCKFFLNRETNLESLTFVIRSFGGQVSWDRSVAEGCIFSETDETITHQIVDRPNVERKYLSRYYIQPQWVYDCVNARMFLPIQDYFPGVTLPPHLSPFDIVGDLYVPPEKEKLEAMKRGDIPVHAFPLEEESTDGESDVEMGIYDEKAENEDDDDDDNDEEEEEEEDESEEKTEEEVDPEKQKILDEMQVVPGMQTKVKNTAAKDEQEQYKLSVSMIPRKKKRIYRKLRRQEKERFYKCEKLRRKRVAIEQEKAEMVKAAKKDKKTAEENIIKNKTKKAKAQ